ncbi:MAG: hypothetical protein AAGH89_05415 [Verrucomicrobiota bacterium]
MHDLDAILALAKRHCTISVKGVHGVAHWQRVRENGQRVAEGSGANLEVVELFAYLHDCCRVNDWLDPRHGPRAADYAETLRGTAIQLEDDAFDLLYEAIHDHTSGHHHDDVTIGTCWDADRLDIGRVGKRPNRKYLSTAAAKDEAVMTWAYQRSLGR